MIELKSTTKKAAKGDVEPLFSIDGVEYTVPKVLPASLVLRYLRTARSAGVDVAMGELFEQAIGCRGIRGADELRRSHGDDLGNLMRVVEAKVRACWTRKSPAEPAKGCGSSTT
ncbi:hypothetical protein HBB16_04455 [Pseudonocardia sp. MCCB 268]|nr:hypothetical protein [Pseudonocardia cytotoxica]